MHWSALASILQQQVPTLAQLLRANGYTTAALVNDAQVDAHSGLNRGFERWQEFHEGEPEGDCEHITAEALAWLGTGPPRPFFLFLHYYDPHFPYDPPPRYREAFGSRLNGAEAKRIYWQARRPESRQSGAPAWRDTAARRHSPRRRRAPARRSGQGSWDSSCGRADSR